MIRNLEALLSAQFEQKDIELHFVEGASDLSVYADAEKLRQILINLLSNAAKFTERGGRVMIDCGAHDGWVEIQVHDSGVGIPPEKTERIFEPYAQPNLGRSEHDGAAPGLVISRGLARAMNGELFVATAFGVGSTFTLRLPARPPR